MDNVSTRRVVVVFLSLAAAVIILLLLKQLYAAGPAARLKSPTSNPGAQMTPTSEQSLNYTYEYQAWSNGMLVALGTFHASNDITKKTCAGTWAIDSAVPGTSNSALKNRIGPQLGTGSFVCESFADGKVYLRLGKIADYEVVLSGVPTDDKLAGAWKFFTDSGVEASDRFILERK